MLRVKVVLALFPRHRRCATKKIAAALRGTAARTGREDKD
jgi:hypothetical protein